MRAVSLKSSFRHITKNRFLSLITILGWSISMAVFAMIIRYVLFEYSFDRFHSKADRIFRINKVVTEPGHDPVHHAITSGMMGPTIRAEFPEVESMTRVLPWFNDVLISTEHEKRKLGDVVFVDPEFLDIFDFDWLAGSKAEALSKPLTAVVTDETAKLFFGDQDPIGRTIIAFQNKPVTVTGVIRTPPGNSHLNFNMLISWSSTVAYQFDFMNTWLTQVDVTYILLRKEVPPAALQSRLDGLIPKYLSEKSGVYRLYLQPLTDIHLRSSGIMYNRTPRIGNVDSVHAFIAIGILILLIAVINHVNLMGSQGIRRSTEFIVRKILGASRIEVVVQWLAESVLLALIALPVSWLLIETGEPFFDQVVGVHMKPWYQEWSLCIGYIVVALAMGVLTSIYPAIIVSRSNAVQNMKGGMLAWTRPTLTRKVLIASQFSIAIVLLVATWTAEKQLNFMRSKNLGFDREQLVVFPIGPTVLSDKYEIFRDQLLSHPEVTSVSASNRVPGQLLNGYGIVPEGFPENSQLTAQTMEIDDSFIPTYGLQILEGSRLPVQSSGRRESILINQAMAHFLQWPNPIGKTIRIEREMTGRVVGVVNDFHVRSLHEVIEPLILFPVMPDNISYATMRVRSQSVAEAIEHAGKIWKSMETNYPFDYFFFDDAFGKFYLKEVQLSVLLKIFAGFGIFLACLGLFGLVTLAVQARVREIGIRKVLGASGSRIVRMLALEYGTLILASNAVAWPVSSYLMQAWLDDYAYRIELSWTMLAGAGAAVLAVALLSISFQALRAAAANPVEALKYE